MMLRILDKGLIMICIFRDVSYWLHCAPNAPRLSERRAAQLLCEMKRQQSTMPPAPQHTGNRRVVQVTVSIEIDSDQVRMIEEIWRKGKY